jgi:hypothetical protein
MIDNDAVRRPYTRPANTAETYQGGRRGHAYCRPSASGYVRVCVSVCVRVMCVRERAGEDELTARVDDGASVWHAGVRVGVRMRVLAAQVHGVFASRMPRQPCAAASARLR